LYVEKTQAYWRETVQKNRLKQRKGQSLRKIAFYERKIVKEIHESEE